MNLFIHWDVDPIFIQAGPLKIAYYGLFFAISFLLGIQLMKKMVSAEGIQTKLIDDLFIYIVLGTIIGARLGHVFFYGWEYYSQHLLEIFMVWKGGLASHGATIGIILSVILFSRKVKRSPLWVLDRLVVVIALAAVFIRLGNLMNSEIYGVETTLPWGFIFERNGETVPKHPTQIYEALGYLVTFLVLSFLFWKKKAGDKQGLIFGLSLVFIFGSRFLIEIIKENQEAFEEGMVLNLGQTLSIPFVLIGLYFALKAKPGTGTRIIQ